MKSLWFIVPAHGRRLMALVCLKQLRRTCHALRAEHGVDAHAVVISDDPVLLAIAEEYGHGTIERENIPLGRKWNDGYELAGREGVDYCVPLGTDDWVDADWIAQELPAPDSIRCARGMAMVGEDGRRIGSMWIPYEAGHGIRIIPTALLRPLGYRPATEDAPRAIDTHVLRNIKKAHGRTPALRYVEAHRFQVVDWKSGTQLNTYDMCSAFREEEQDDPFAVLAGTYPAEALEEMRGVYAGLHRQ